MDNKKIVKIVVLAVVALIVGVLVFSSLVTTPISPASITFVSI